MGNDKRDAPAAYLVGSALAAVVNFPLWKASAMAQSGFKTKSRGYFAAYAEALRPPYRGVAAVVGGMTWARFAIFYGSDVGRRFLVKGKGGSVPPLLLFYCRANYQPPIIRASSRTPRPTSGLPKGPRMLLRGLRGNEASGRCGTAHQQAS